MMINEIKNEITLEEAKIKFILKNDGKIVYLKLENSEEDFPLEERTILGNYLINNNYENLSSEEKWELIENYEIMAKLTA
jgi:hypothetical protein